VFQLKSGTPGTSGTFGTFGTLGTLGTLNYQPTIFPAMVYGLSTMDY
jgi:hypothetical protein